MQSINDFLTEDHRRLDELIENFQEWKAKDLARARGFLSQFAAGLHRHLLWEETIIFPAFEEASQGGLIRTLVAEHQEIREWLQALTTRVEEDAASDCEETMLMEELGGHNGREEYALYPELDKLLRDEEKARILAALI
ncbi:MAG: hemerythrin domain-containing protein [Thermomicrobiales bacterium]